MARRYHAHFVMPLLLVLICAPQSQAARPTKSLLPKTTKGFISVPDVDLLRNQWNQTQLGQLVADPLMKPFVEDLREQLDQKFGKTQSRLQITLEDIDGVDGGEVAIALIQPNNDKQQHAQAILVDVTGKSVQAQALLDRVGRKLTTQGAKRTSRKVGKVEVISYALPKEAGEKLARTNHYFLHQDQLVACDHLATTEFILARFEGNLPDTLETLPAFSVSMNRCETASRGEQPQIRWFVEPFGYMEASRLAQGGRKRRGTDMLKVLENQGFKAVQGMGGYVFLMLDGHEIRHHTSIYAPPVKQGDEKYELAANMLSFPNRSDLKPQSWVPADVASYLTFSWEMQKAFKYSKTLVDEVAGAAVFDDIMDSLKNDPNGPRIDVYEEFVRHLGQRVTFFTDVIQPIDTNSERWMLGLEVTDPVAVANTLNKAMEADPDAKKHVIGDQIIWEIVEQEADEVETLQIAGPGGLGGFGDAPAQPEQEKPMLPNSVLTVAHGNLIIASHVDFVVEVLDKAKTGKSLKDAKQYKLVAEAVSKIGASVNSFHFFSKTDKALHPTYELIRMGKMPQSKTLFGILLNRLLAPEEEGVARTQEINGEKLPPFDQIRHYLGPAGVVVSSLPDGWFVSGCLLTRPADADDAETGELVSKNVPERR